MIRIFYFGHLAEITRTPSAEIDLNRGNRVDELLSALVDRHAELGPMLPSIAVAVNEKYATLDQILEDGDTVALIPPVSGG